MMMSNNERVSQLIELYATDLSSNDVFLVTDMSQLESKKLEMGQLLYYIENSGSFYVKISDTASYVSSSNVDGIIPVANVASQSISSSYISSSNVDGIIPVANVSSQSVSSSFSNFSISSSYSVNADTSSYSSWCIQNTVDSDTSSYLLYQGFANGTSSYSMVSSFSDNSISASYSPFSDSATSASYSSGSDIATYSDNLNYYGLPNGTSSFSISSSNSTYSNTSSYVDLTNFVTKTYGVSNPMGTISVGNNQYVWSLNKYSNITSLFNINTDTNNASYITTNTAGDSEMSVALLTSDLGNNYIVGFSSTKAYYTLNLSNNVYTRYNPNVINLIGYSPVKIVESSTPSTPSFYAVSSNTSSVLTSGLLMIEVYYNDTSHWVSTPISGILNLNGNNYSGASIFNQFESVSGQPSCFLYNPIKKRFYVMVSGGTGFLHIFNFNTFTDGDIDAWWASATRYSYLTYEKSIILEGNDAYTGDVLAEHYTLEYDLITGQEYFINFIRRGNGAIDGAGSPVGAINGSLIKIPWKEN